MIPVHRRVGNPLRRLLPVALLAGLLVGPPVGGAAGRSQPLAFNDDREGMPQAEESVTACRTRPEVVLGGSIDYRGVLRPVANLVGWHLSIDGGRSLAAEGFLPPIDVDGMPVPSAADPVVAADGDCRLYAAAYNTDRTRLRTKAKGPSGIGLYRSDPTTLSSCGQGSDPACWPHKRLAAASRQDGTRQVSLDKPWMDVGDSGKAGRVVWVAYIAFMSTADGGSLPSAIEAVRCDADLLHCSDPIPLSAPDHNAQLPDLVIGPDGRTYVSWIEFDRAETTEPDDLQLFGKQRGAFALTHTAKLRVAPAGSLEFGPERTVAVEDHPVPYNGVYPGNAFGAFTNPRLEVAALAGGVRIFHLTNRCGARPLRFVCEEPDVVLRSSDDDGATWSEGPDLAGPGDDILPAMAVDPVDGRLAVAWYTSRRDPLFNHRYDVEVATIDAVRLRVTRRQIITPYPSDPDADPLNNFLGHYFDIFAHHGTALVHYSASYRPERLRGEGVPVPQTDNFLGRVRL